MSDFSWTSLETCYCSLLPSPVWSIEQKPWFSYDWISAHNQRPSTGPIIPSVGCPIKPTAALLPLPVPQEIGSPGWVSPPFIRQSTLAPLGFLERWPTSTALAPAGERNVLSTPCIKVERWLIPAFIFHTNWDQPPTSGAGFRSTWLGEC